MSGLASLPAWLLVVGWLACALLVAVLGRLLARAIVPAPERTSAQGVVAPLMPALGATFAVLMAITLSSEAGYLKSGQDIVSTEAAAAARLAWAATSPGVATERVQSALGEYLRATRNEEWDGDDASRGDDASTRAAIVALERAVRADAVDSDLGTPVSTELLVSLDAMTSARRARLAAASRDLPTLYVVTLVASGVALIANAGALVIGVGRRSSALVGGLAVVVGLSLALLFSITAPWRGSLHVSGQAIDAVADDVEAGFFTP